MIHAHVSDCCFLWILYIYILHTILTWFLSSLLALFFASLSLALFLLIIFIVALFRRLSSQGLWEPMELPWPRMQAGRHSNSGMWAAWADKNGEPIQQEVGERGLKRESKRWEEKRVQSWSQEHDGMRVNKLVSRGRTERHYWKHIKGISSKRTERRCGTKIQARAKRELQWNRHITQWQWEASLIALCISFTSLAVSTNRIGSTAWGLGRE